MPARSIGSRCNGACFCAARSYNRGEPQGALTPHGSRIASAVWLLVTAPCPCGSGAAPLSLSRTPANWKRTQGSPLSRPKRSWRPPPSVRSLAREHLVERGVVPRRLCASYLLVLRPRITRRWRASSADLPRSRALSTRFQRGFHISCQCFQHSLSVRLA